MMRHGSTIGVGLGLLVVVPGLAAPQGADELKRALGETVRALEVLGGLETSLPKLPADHAMEIVRSATEAPPGNLLDERARDERLQELRKSVSRLQMAHDELARVASPSAGDTNVPVSTQALAEGTVNVTTGLDESLRSRLTQAPSTPPMRSSRSMSAGTTPSASSKPFSTDVPGTPDDLVRQGQALYRAEKYQDVLALLRGIEGDPRAKYWSARALERLGRFDDAIALYKLVAADPKADYLAPRAKSDVEFLEWKRDFSAKVEARNAAAAMTPAEKSGAAKNTKEPK